MSVIAACQLPCSSAVGTFLLSQHVGYRAAQHPTTAVAATCWSLRRTRDHTSRYSRVGFRDILVIFGSLRCHTRCQSTPVVVACWSDRGDHLTWAARHFSFRDTLGQCSRSPLTRHNSMPQRTSCRTILHIGSIPALSRRMFGGRVWACRYSK